MRRHGATALLALVVLCLGAIATPLRATADDAVVSSKQIAALPCADLLFVGARGSGEEGVEGKTIPAVRRRILSDFPGKATAVYLDYPAISTHVLGQSDIEGYLLDDKQAESEFFSSVSEGTTELDRVLRHAATACPAQKIVVVGFSQGAQVVTATLATSPAAGAITATLLLGNPSHYPGQHVRELDGQVDTAAFGMQALLEYLRERGKEEKARTRREKLDVTLKDVFALYEGLTPTADIAASLRSTGTVIPPSSYARTFSLCSPGDVVCDFAPALSRILSNTSTSEMEINQARPIHGGYSPAMAPRTFHMLAELLSPAGFSRPTPSTPALSLATASPTVSPTARRTVTRTVPHYAREDKRPSWAVAALIGVGGLAMGFGLGQLLRRRKRP